MYGYGPLGYETGSDSGKTEESWDVINGFTKEENKFEKTYTVECTIPDRRKSNLSIKEFDSNFYGVKPVIFRNTNVNSQLLATLHRKTLLQRHGSTLIAVASNSDGIYPLEKRPVRKMTLSQFVRAISSWPPQNFYFLDSADGEFLHKARTETNRTLFDEYLAPSLLEQKRQFQGKQMRMTMGGAGGGIAFHQHAGSYDEIFVGAKRWSIFPPGQAPLRQGYSVYQSHLSWLRERHKLDARDPPPWECVQYPGDVVYIPDGWMHATLHLRRTIGMVKHADKALPQTAVYFQTKAMALLSTRKDELDRAAVKVLQRAEKFMNRAIELDPTNDQYHAQLSEILSQQGKKKAQYETILKGLSLNKKCSALRFKLIQVCLELSEDSRLALNRDKETDFLTQAFEEILVQHQDQGGLKEAPHDHDFLKLLQEIAWRLDQEEKVELSENEVHERRLQDGTILTSVRAQMLLSTFFV